MYINSKEISMAFLPVFVKFVFSKKVTKFEKIFTLTKYCQINGEDIVKYCGLLRKHELYDKITAQIKFNCKDLAGKVNKSIPTIL